MKYTLYAVQDTMIGFGTPFIKINEEVAKRDYKNFLQAEPNRKDMRLFKLGEYDDETGIIDPVIPTIIEGGYIDE